jgi:hypothetical protein
MPRVVEVHVPAVIQPADGDDAFRRRVLSEVDLRLRGMAEGLAHHVTQVVDARMAAHESKLDAVVALLEQDRDERIAYRAVREDREKLENEHRASEMHRLALQKGGIEIQRSTVEIQQIPTESARKYRLALLGLLGGVIAALAGLFGAAIGSRK